ncbi:MAG: hypothetical protein JO115_09625 [Pseudonocardiales bacterium]|nr:hypothetical protein [Pseudonocardiales bacterium]
MSCADGLFHHDPVRDLPTSHVPHAGTAWIHTDGTMTTTGNPEIGDQLAAVVQQWDTTGRPRVGDWTMQWRDTGTAGLLLPHRWPLRRC